MIKKNHEQAMQLQKKEPASEIVNLHFDVLMAEFCHKPTKVNAHLIRNLCKQGNLTLPHVIRERMEGILNQDAKKTLEFQEEDEKKRDARKWLRLNIVKLVKQEIKQPLSKYSIDIAISNIYRWLGEDPRCRLFYKYKEASLRRMYDEEKARHRKLYRRCD